VLETHLGWVAKTGFTVEGAGAKGGQPARGRASAGPGTRTATPVFDGAREEEIVGLLGSTIPEPRRQPDGAADRQGAAVRRPVRGALPRGDLGRATSTS
jgi:DNA-directed RNA polymerase beta subunit